VFATDAGPAVDALAPDVAPDASTPDESALSGDIPPNIHSDPTGTAWVPDDGCAWATDDPADLSVTCQ
jgi:hypothetical protein